MKVLLLRGAPRKNGYTQQITDKVVSGILREKDIELTNVYLPSKKIESCSGCFHCWSHTPGKCIYNDDMTELLELYKTSDLIIFSTPLYHYSISSYTKKFLERTMPIMEQGLIEGKNSLFRNKVRDEKNWIKKKIAVISAGAFRSLENFSGLRKTFGLIESGTNIEETTFIFRPESHLLQFNLAKPRTIKLIDTALVRCGIELARTGSVCKETLSMAASTLIDDIELFRIYSNIYWEHFTTLGEKSSDNALLIENVTSDIRILIRELTRSVDSVATSRLKAVYRFEFTDLKKVYEIRVNHGEAFLSEEISPDCDIDIITDSVTWASAFKRKISMRDALMSRKIILKGDKSLFTRMDKYFPPPVI